MNDYKLSCGQVFKKTIKEDHLFLEHREIYKEHGTFHVREFNSVKGSSSVDRISWESFDSFKDAKKAFNKK